MSKIVHGLTMTLSGDSCSLVSYSLLRKQMSVFTGFPVSHFRAVRLLPGFSKCSLKFTRELRSSEIHADETVRQLNLFYSLLRGKHFIIVAAL